MLAKKELLHRLLGEGLALHPDLLDEIKTLAAPLPPDAELPFLDREEVQAEDLTDLQKEWRENGVVILKNFIPETLIDHYRAIWLLHNRITENRPRGYRGFCPWSKVKSLEDIATWGPLAEVLQQLTGEPMGVHLCLTGWKSTERDWHQDGYLSPDETKNHSLAIWVALGDVHEDSGPFQYIPGTHLLPPIALDKTLAHLDEEERRSPEWPRYTERFLSPMFENIINACNLKEESFLANKGDILIWHTRLIHRGSVPVNPQLWRESVVMHFSGIRHRPDFPKAVQHPGGGWSFPIVENPQQQESLTPAS